MGKINYYHKGLKDKWLALPLSLQMANIGSEVSRALMFSGKDDNLSRAAFYRALELVDFTIESLRQQQSPNLTEVLIAREELCDYFYGDNEFHTDPRRLQKYYDDFALYPR